MTKFEVLQKIIGVKEYSDIIFDLARKMDSAEALAEELSSIIPEEGLQTLKSIAQNGNYPLSLEGMQ